MDGCQNTTDDDDACDTDSDDGDDVDDIVYDIVYGRKSKHN